MAVVPEQIVASLSRETSQDLLRQARTHGLTLNTLVQGAWGILLARLTNRTDAVFGITVAGRPPEISGVESMVGLFINTVPLRVQFSDGERVIDLLKRLQERQSLLMAHQYLGLSEIQRDAGVGSLFDTLLIFENYPADWNSFGTKKGSQAQPTALRVSSIEGRDATHYPLTLLVMPGERLHLRLDYRSDFLERGLAEGLCRWLMRVLEVIASNPQGLVSRIDLLGSEEREQILEVWNQTAQAVPDTTVSELFEQQVERTPDADALVFGGERLSYGELNKRANQLAEHLIKKGAGPEEIVALAVPRSIEMMVGLLGILKSGAAYLPLDPEYPPERLRLMLDDAAPRLLLTTSELRSQLPDHVPTVVLDGDEVKRLLAECSGTCPATRVVLQHPAYMIYTSGSTGQPKGVVIEHQALASFTLGIKHYSLFASVWNGDRYLAVTEHEF